MRESRLRGIERKMDRIVEYGRCLLIFLVIQLNAGEGQRKEEPWNLDAGVGRCVSIPCFNAHFLYANI